MIRATFLGKATALHGMPEIGFGPSSASACFASLLDPAGAPLLAPVGRRREQSSEPLPGETGAQPGAAPDGPRMADAEGSPALSADERGAQPASGHPPPAVVDAMLAPVLAFTAALTMRGAAKPPATGPREADEAGRRRAGHAAKADGASASAAGVAPALIPIPVSSISAAPSSTTASITPGGVRLTDRDASATPTVRPFESTIGHAAAPVAIVAAGTSAREVSSVELAEIGTLAELEPASTPNISSRGATQPHRDTRAVSPAARSAPVIPGAARFALEPGVGRAEIAQELAPIAATTGRPLAPPIPGAAIHALAASLRTAGPSLSTEAWSAARVDVGRAPVRITAASTRLTIAPPRSTSATVEQQHQSNEESPASASFASPMARELASPAVRLGAPLPEDAAAMIPISTMRQVDAPAVSSGHIDLPATVDAATPQTSLATPPLSLPPARPLAFGSRDPGVSSLTERTLSARPTYAVQPLTATPAAPGTRSTPLDLVISVGTAEASQLLASSSDLRASPSVVPRPAPIDSSQIGRSERPPIQPARVAQPGQATPAALAGLPVERTALATAHAIGPQFGASAQPPRQSTSNAAPSQPVSVARADPPIEQAASAAPGPMAVPTREGAAPELAPLRSPADGKADAPNHDIPSPIPAATDAAMTVEAASAGGNSQITSALAPMPHIGIPAAALDPGVAPAAPTADAVHRQLDLASGNVWLDRLSADIAASTTGNAPLRFALAPERLGRMSVELAAAAEGTTLKLTVETHEAHRIVAEAQPQLVAEARAQGLRITDTQIDLGGGRQGQGQHPGQQASAFAGDGSSGQRRPAAAPDRADTLRTSATLPQPHADPSGTTRSDLYA